MINANELRIKNWVYTPDGLRLVLGVNNWGKITVETNPPEIHPSTAYFSYTESECKPIPITPEILEKCGFSFGVNLQSFVKGRHQFVEIKNTIDGYLSEDGVFYYGVRTKIHYLHQLQNLYFALTNTELNYTP